MKSIFNKEKLNLEKKNIKENTISFFQGFSISILNPKILVWFIAIYSQFMSTDNEILFNIYLVLIAGIIDACWYIISIIGCYNSFSIKFFSNKNNAHSKNSRFFLYSSRIGEPYLINLLI